MKLEGKPSVSQSRFVFLISKLYSNPSPYLLSHPYHSLLQQCCPRSSRNSTKPCSREISTRSSSAARSRTTDRMSFCSVTQFSLPPKTATSSSPPQQTSPHPSAQYTWKITSYSASASHRYQLPVTSTLQNQSVVSPAQIAGLYSIHYTPRTDIHASEDRPL